MYVHSHAILRLSWHVCVYTPISLSALARAVRKVRVEENPITHASVALPIRSTHIACAHTPPSLLWHVQCSRCYSTKKASSKPCLVWILPSVLVRCTHSVALQWRRIRNARTLTPKCKHKNAPIACLDSSRDQPQPESSI